MVIKINGETIYLMALKNVSKIKKYLDKRLYHFGLYIIGLYVINAIETMFFAQIILKMRRRRITIIHII